MIMGILRPFLDYEGVFHPIRAFRQHLEYKIKNNMFLTRRKWLINLLKTFTFIPFLWTVKVTENLQDFILKLLCRIVGYTVAYMIIAFLTGVLFVFLYQFFKWLIWEKGILWEVAQ